VGGPDAGRARGLAPPGLEVGRATSGGLTLDDPSLSRRHARVDVSADGVRVVDLGSTNGVQVDGAPAADGLPADTSSTIRLGASTVRIRRAPGPGMPVDHPGDGTAGVVPGRLVVPDLAAVVVEAPPPPTEPPRHRLPWVAALAPLPVVAVLALLMGPRLLVFAVVGPVAVLASSLADRVGGRRRHRAALARHEVATAEARERLADAVAAETTRRAVRHPGPDEVLARAEHRLPGLWGGPDDLTVRLGLGDVPSRAAWRADGVLHPGTAEHVPVTVDLAAAGCLGVVAPPETARRVVAAVVGQLVVALPPSRLALRVRGSPVGDEPAHVWPALLPHTGGPGRRTLLVVEGAPPGTDAAEEVRAVVDEGGAAIVAAATDGDLPDGCGMVLSPAGGGHWTLRGPLGSVDLVGDAVGPGWRDRLARALAPLRETGGDAALPASLGVADVDARPLTVPGVLERWSAGEGPTATVGVTAAGPYVLDLRADGPHVLVGGTTGSGKSEFLRTLVTGLALASPPDGVTLLLVDFKGGAAFGPCADLPHVVGLVTDLHAHLAGRVLASLAAELRRRERLLAEAGATDLDAYVRSGATEPLPRLVVVVDELRTLVDELPDGVRRLVRLAAQGRSLGIHLVLATQRPSGAVTPEVQANVDLRIAFRVRDRADAVGVVEDARAADIPA
ncbi:FtsK/SpoIIIE domain-containing protein, partial [Phycicoccus flavus]|uniref:FtsK/SpoIIIE domain-containing protein n=1 Tax=Phycicoccus flavus TaxID=2502783 RepID=UPI00197B430C